MGSFLRRRERSLTESSQANNVFFGWIFSQKHFLEIEENKKRNLSVKLSRGETFMKFTVKLAGEQQLIVVQYFTVSNQKSLQAVIIFSSKVDLTLASSTSQLKTLLNILTMRRKVDEEHLKKVLNGLNSL